MKRHLIAFLAALGVVTVAGGALAAGSGCVNTTASVDGGQGPSSPVPTDAQSGRAG